MSRGRGPRARSRMRPWSAWCDVDLGDHAAQCDALEHPGDGTPVWSPSVLLATLAKRYALASGPRP